MAGAWNTRARKARGTLARRTRKPEPILRRSDSGHSGGRGGEHERPLCGDRLAADQGSIGRRRGPDPVLAQVAICAMCRREARGFGYVHQLRLDRFAYYRFCSMRCLDGGSALTKRNNGVIDLTDMEIRAIKEARRFLAEALNELGLMAPFHDRKPEEIDRIIEACIDGFRDSMQRQAEERNALNDSIPF